MGEHDQRGAGVHADLGKCLVRPFARNLGIGEPFLRSKGSTRVDDHDVMSERASHRNKLLRDMHSADDDEADGGIEYIDEDLAGVSGEGHTLVAEKSLFEGGR